MDTSVACELIRGHRVASGLASDSPYPSGTIALQKPVFKALGLDLNAFYPATLNLDIKPRRWELRLADYVFENVNWLEGVPAETFSFVDCEVQWQKTQFKALIYYPHPDTKPAHHQSETVIEVLAPCIQGCAYGDEMRLTVDEQKFRFR